MGNRSRSTLFLMEQLIVILVFAICAAACVRIFVGSYLMATDSRDTKNALLLAENVAECYKSASGDTAKVVRILGASADLRDDTTMLFFDAKLQACAEEVAVYIVSLVEHDTDEVSASTIVSDLSVVHASGEEIIAFTVAARRTTG